MSRSSFASFHLTGIKPTSGKMMTSSVDRLFENDGDVFLSSNFADFQVNIFIFVFFFSLLFNFVFILLGTLINTRNSSIKITRASSKFK